MRACRPLSPVDESSQAGGDQEMAWSPRRGVSSACVAWAIALPVTTATCLGQPVDVPHRSELKGLRGPVTGLDTSTDGRLLITTEDGRTNRIWDLESGALWRTIEQERVGKTIKIWDAAPGGGRSLIREEPISQARISAEARRMRGPRTPLYEEPISSLRLYAGFLSENRRIWIAIEDELQRSVSPDELLSYDLETRALETIFSTGSEEESPHTRALTNRTCSRRGSLVVYRVYKQPVETVSGDTYIYDRDKKQVLARIADADLSLDDFTISDRGELLASLSHSDYFTRRRAEWSGRIELWNPKTGERMGRVQTDGVRLDGFMEFSPDNKDLAVLGGLAHNRIFVIYLNGGKIRYTLKTRELPGQRPCYFWPPVYTPDGKYLTAPMTNGTVLFWDTRDYREVLWARLFPPTWPGGLSIAISRDGKKLCGIYQSKGENNVVKVWDMDQFLSLIKKRNEKAQR
jgi:WD40 repeat protein